MEFYCIRLHCTKNKSLRYIRYYICCIDNYHHILALGDIISSILIPKSLYTPYS